MTTWRVAVLGPGGVGGLLGAVLARAGVDVLCLARPGTAAHLREHGLTLRSPHFGDISVPVRAAGTLDEPVDACLVTVKANALADAAEAVPPPALGEALVVPFLNGVDHVVWLRDRYPADQVVAATITVEATRVTPGVVQHGTPFATVQVGHGPAPRERVDALVSMLVGAGLDVTPREDERVMLWSKLAVLAPMALLTTHARAPLGEVRAARRGDLVAVIDEVVAAAGADGIALDGAELLTWFDSRPASFRSSMMNDAEAGRPLELDAIGGAILRAAGRGGLDVPVTARLVEDLRARA
ncbi:MAG: ketopantoate reductase family protein [Egibacteraceae bacterium]